MSIETTILEANGSRQVGTEAGYAPSLTDIGAFGQAMAAAEQAAGGGQAASAVAGQSKIMPIVSDMLSALTRIDTKARATGEMADGMMLSGKDLTPGEVIKMSMRSHEFMFHCQLSSSVANRTSEGLQQLFRQQS